MSSNDKLQVTGNITVTGTVDGRDVSVDGAKLDSIEYGATADQTITAGVGLLGGGTGDVTISLDVDYVETIIGDISGSTGFTGSQGLTGFTGSRGTQGVAGFTGSQGIQGTTGFAGSKGDQGTTGFVGSRGFTGSKGDQGTTGFTGSKGDQGTIGFTGSQGTQGTTGFVGSKGDQGTTGFVGSKGDQGVAGFTGSRGFTGSQGVIGFTGSQGIRGTTGFVGSKGDQGVTGFTGSQGIQGTTGFTGSQGIQGTIGFSGSRGFTGSQGIQGTTGFTGSAGSASAGGTDGQILYNNGGVIAGANVWFNDTNQRLGIGTSSPTERLDVTGVIRSDSGFRFGSTNNYWYESSADAAALRIGTDGPYLIFADTGGSAFFNNASGALDIGTTGTPHLRITSAGRIGIGTDAPTEKLDLRGNLRIGVSTANSNFITFAGTPGDTNTTTHIGERIYDSTEKSELLLFKGNDIVGASGPDRIRLFSNEIRFDTYTVATAGTFNAVGASGNAINRMIVSANGNVGIGTSSPSTLLDVNGGVNIDGLITGTAITQSVTDTTAGRVLKVGDFGLGGPIIEFTGDVDDPDELPSGFYRVQAGATGTKPGSLTAFSLISARRGVSPYGNSIQVALGGVITEVWVREWNGSSWTTWSLQYSRQNILGTVSQSSGIPTGAIIESGSNANGEYVKFADGTAMCWKDLTVSTDTQISSSGIYYNNTAVSWTHPITLSFSKIRVRFGNLNNTSSGIGINQYFEDGSVTSIRAFTIGVRTSIPMRVGVIGRWF